MKTLIIYYSQARGNTQRIAEMIREELNCGIEKIDTAVPYTGTYAEISAQGQEEVKRGYMPQLRDTVQDPADYERIIVLTPTWWYTMAPAVRTYLNDHDFRGKHMVFVQTHAGWPGTTLDDMSALAGGITDSTYAVKFDSEGGNRLETGETEIRNWIRTL